MDKNLVLLTYHDSLGDNLASIAYSKLLQNNAQAKAYYQNSTNKRQILEEKMSYFDIDFEYISQNHVSEITKKAYMLNDKILNPKKIKKKIAKNNAIIDLPFFMPSDFNLFTKEIIDSCDIKNTDFITNYDILERINTTNSIGIYINEKDLTNNVVDFKYITKALNRLNKYLKKPKIFVFINNYKENNIDFDYDYEILNLNNHIEEFYFLKSCKHKIVLNTPNSYTTGLWATFLNKNENSYAVFDKKLLTKKVKQNWLGI